MDASGNAYLTGNTDSADFPLASPFQGASGGMIDAFVAKVNPAGSALVYSTYLGGSGDDFGDDIAVDAAGNAYIAGGTMSADFPTAAAGRGPVRRGKGGTEKRRIDGEKRARGNHPRHVAGGRL